MASGERIGAAPLRDAASSVSGDRHWPGRPHDEHYGIGRTGHEFRSGARGYP